MVLLTPGAALASHAISISNLPSILPRNAAQSFTVTVTQPTSIFSCRSSGTVSVFANRSDVSISPSSYSVTDAGGAQSRAVTVITGNNGGPVVITAQFNSSCGLVGASASSFIQGRANIAAATTFFTFQNRTIGVNVDTALPSGTFLTFGMSVSGTAAPGTSITSSTTISGGQNFQPVNVLPGALNGPMTIHAGLSGSAAPYFTAPDPTTVAVAGVFGLTGTNPCCVRSGGSATVTAGLQMSGSFTANTVTTPFSITPSLSGAAAPGSTISPVSQEYAAGASGLPFVITAGSTIGDLRLSFGASNAYASTLSSVIFKVRGTMALENKPASLSIGSTSGPITINLSHPAITTWNLALLLQGNTVGASLSTSSITFNPGDTEKTFTVTGGTAAGTLLVVLNAPISNSYFETTSASIAITNDSAPTAAGTNVTVTPPVPSGGAVAVNVTYDEVTTAGETKLTNVTTQVAPPSGYEIPGTPLYFGLTTTATTTGTTTVCASYPNGAAADETALRLFTLGGDGWVDTTSTIDTTGNTICAETVGGTTFAIFRLNSAPEVGAITGPAGIVAGGATQQFSATFTDADATDTHTGTWVWGDDTTSPAVIEQVDGVWTATGEHAFAGGTYQVRLVISDGGQPAASADFEVTADAAPPVIQALTASPESLWQPDSKMHDVVLTVSATDDTGTPVCEITGVSATAQNVKQTAYAITGPLSVQLKAFPHASYAITVTCTDAVGRTTQQSVAVSVGKQ